MKRLADLDSEQLRAVVFAIVMVAMFASMAAGGIAEGCSYRECVKTHSPKECK